MPKFTGYGKRKMPSSFKKRSKKKKAKAKGSASNTNKGQIAILKKRVAALNRSVEMLNGEMIYRSVAYTSGEAAQNTGHIINTSLGSKTAIQLALAELRYYDPQNASALVNTSFAAGAYSKSISFTSMSFKARYRANNKMGLRYTIYLCHPKVDNANTVGTDWTAFALNTIYSETSSEKSIVSFPSDIRALGIAWNIKRVKKGYLRPGQFVEYSYSYDKPWLFNDAYIEDQALEYQKNLHSAFIMIKIQGPIAFDTTNAALGRARTEIICECVSTYRVKYDAGADIKYVVISDVHGTFTDATSDRVGMVNDPTIGQTSDT